MVDDAGAPGDVSRRGGADPVGPGVEPGQQAVEPAVGTLAEAPGDVVAVEADRDVAWFDPARQHHLDQRVAAGDQVAPVGEHLDDEPVGAGGGPLVRAGRLAGLRGQRNGEQPDEQAGNQAGQREQGTPHDPLNDPVCRSSRLTGCAGTGMRSS